MWPSLVNRQICRWPYGHLLNFCTNIDISITCNYHMVIHGWYQISRVLWVFGGIYFSLFLTKTNSIAACWNCLTEVIQVRSLSCVWMKKSEEYKIILVQTTSHVKGLVISDGGGHSKFKPYFMFKWFLFYNINLYLSAQIWQTTIKFFLISRKIGLYISCKLRQFAWNIKAFWKKKNIYIFQIVFCWNFYTAC